jgi:hypothetical protein
MALFDQIGDSPAGTLGDRAVDLLIASPALLKVLAFLMAWGGLWLPIAILLTILRRVAAIEAEPKLLLLLPLYLIVPFIIWGATGVEGLTWVDYGIPISHLLSLIASLGWGLVLAAIGLTVIFGGECLLGWANWQPENSKRWTAISWPLLLLGLWIGGTEELVFRGWLQTTLQADYAYWIAAAIASAIFALSHLLWERQETIPQLPGLWLLGMLLTLARWVDGGNLGLAWGLHAGWIWGLSSLDTAGLISYPDKSPKWLTGWRNKPLAGVAGLICLLLTGGLLFLFFHR